MKSNKDLAAQGEDILEGVVLSWLRGAFPALPEEGIQVTQGLSLVFWWISMCLNQTNIVEI